MRGLPSHFALSLPVPHSPLCLSLTQSSPHLYAHPASPLLAQVTDDDNLSAKGHELRERAFRDLRTISDLASVGASAGGLTYSDEALSAAVAAKDLATIKELKKKKKLRLMSEAPGVPSVPIDELDAQALDLVTFLLEPDPDARISASEALDHVFLRDVTLDWETGAVVSRSPAAQDISALLDGLSQPATPPPDVAESATDDESPAAAAAAADAGAAEESKGPIAARASNAAPVSAAAAASGAGGAELTDEALFDLLGELDLVVGVVTACSEHDVADSLYVVTIDVGAARGGERTVVSGLDKHVSVDDMVGASVVVVANLKPNGTVLAATSHAGDVALVRAPAGAKPGDRILPVGRTPLKAPAAEVDGSKEGSAWAVCAQRLATDTTGTLVFNCGPSYNLRGHALGVLSIGLAATASVSLGAVS